MGDKAKAAGAKSAKSRASKAKAPKAPKAKAPAKKAEGAHQATGTAERAGVGNKAHPGNKRIPEAAMIRREPLDQEGTKVSESPEVQGNKALQIIDVRNSRPVHVSLIEGMALTKDIDGRVLVIQGNVATNVVPLINARGLFAVKKDGTVIYNHGGFDDVPHADFDLVDIAALIEHNN